MSLPSSLQYKNQRPQGFAAQQTKIVVQPNQSLLSLSQQQQIIFEIEGDGWIDPSNTYFEIQLQYLPYPNASIAASNQSAVVELDGATTSLISELTIFSNERELERIREYDQLAQILYDLNYDSIKQNRQMEGIFNQISNQTQQCVNKTSAAQISGRDSNPAIQLPGFRPTAGYNTFTQGIYIQAAPGNLQYIGTNNSQTTLPAYAKLDLNSGYDGTLLQSDLKPSINTSVQGYGFNADQGYLQLTNTTTQSLTGTSLKQGSHQTGSIPATCFPQSVIQAANIASLSLRNPNVPKIFDLTPVRADLQMVSLDSEYGVQHGKSDGKGLYDFQGGFIEGTHTSAASTFVNQASGGIDQFSTCNNLGYVIPFSETLNAGKSAIFCTNAAANKIVNGKFIRNSVSQYGNAYAATFTSGESGQILQQKFHIPLLSGIIGQLIPDSEWKLIPLKAFGKLRIVLTLNKNAFFTSGSADAKVGDQRAKMSQDFAIKKIQFVSDQYHFESKLEQLMDKKLFSGELTIASQSFRLGNQFIIPPEQSVSSVYQLANQFQSLKGLFFWFISGDYTKYEFCRKQYRLSMNLTSIQLKMGNKFFPQYPIQGHAGNPILQQNSDDNSEFLMQLYKFKGSAFNVDRACSINKFNFALNERSYEPLTQCQLGEALFQERRCRGKALYYIDLKQIPCDECEQQGVDSTQINPFELILKDDQTNKCSTTSEFYSMFNYDILIQFSGSGVTVIGG